MKNRVGIYCRLSIEDKEKIKKYDDSESIQNQKMLLMDYAKNQFWLVYDVYIDDDYSGLDNSRPAFNKMIEDAKNHKFDIILCKNQSRFSRDMEMIEKYLHNLFIIWNIRFVGLIDNVDTFSKGGKKSRQINGLVNEWYCEDISENVKSAINIKKRNGQYLGHWCTYGYELNKVDKHKIVIDEYASVIVKDIYNLYLSGYGVTAIANILTQKQINTPSVYKRLKGKNYFNPAEKKSAYSSKYGIWSVNTIRKILRDKTYLGHLIQGREKKVSYKIDKLIKVPESEWIVVENNHEPIIDIDTFTKVQNCLGVRSTNFNSSIKNNTVPKTHIFASKIRCMECGHNMNKSHGKNHTLYLKCGLALKTKNKNCKLHTVRLDFLTEEITERIYTIIKDYINFEENKILIIKHFSNENNMEKEIKNKKVYNDELFKQQNNIEKALSNAYMEKINGSISVQSFQIINNSFEDELNQINKNISNTQSHIKELDQKIKNYKVNSFEIEKYIFNELTHEIVNDFIDFIEIGEKNSFGEQPINIYWLF